MGGKITGGMDLEGSGVFLIGLGVGGKGEKKMVWCEQPPLVGLWDGSGFLLCVSL